MTQWTILITKPLLFAFMNLTNLYWLKCILTFVFWITFCIIINYQKMKGVCTNLAQNILVSTEARVFKYIFTWSRLTWTCFIRPSPRHISFVGLVFSISSVSKINENKKTNRCKINNFKVIGFFIFCLSYWFNSQKDNFKCFIRPTNSWFV